MKKSVLLVALVLLFTIVAAACSQGEDQNGTAAPGATAGVTQGVGGLESTPFGGSSSTETTGGASTEAPVATATQAMSTEMPTAAVTESGGLSVTQAVSGTAQLPGTGAIDANRLSNMLDFDVVDHNGENVGSVDDMVIDLSQSSVQYVLVDFGGFLGIGSHTVAVPWDQLTLQTANDASRSTSSSGSSVGSSTGITGTTGTATDENVFVLNADKSMIENAPEFNKDMIPGPGESIMDWDVTFRDYWTSGGMTTTTSTQTPGAVGSITSTTTPVAPSSGITSTTGMTNTQGLDAGSQLSQVMLASDLIGMDINTNIGSSSSSSGTSSDTSNAQMTVQDAIVDPNDGSIQYLIVDLSGVNDQDTWIPVPPDLLFKSEGDSLSFADVNLQALAGAPGFTQDQFPNTSSSGWDSDVSTWWGSHTDLTTP